MIVSNSNDRLTYRQIAAIASVAIAHVALSAVGLFGNPRFDDHDSLAYVAETKTFLSGNAEQIWGMNPDAIPLYPFLAAIFSLITGDPEIATRLVSLVASLVTLYCLFLLTRRIGGTTPAIAAIALLAFNPTYVRWSYGILTEPLYVALVTAGITIFFFNCRRLSAWHGSLFGLIFGLSFLTRMEGILFLVAIPLLFVVNRALGNSADSWARIRGASISFVGVFILLATPQVLRVSDTMNTFSLNGRTTWSVVLNTPDDRSYGEKIYGLDHDAATTNLLYLQSNPEAMSQDVKKSGIALLAIGYAKTILKNLRHLHHSVLAPLFGLPALALAMFGLVAILVRRQYADAMLVTAFLGIGIVAPLLHNVNPRHLAVLVPIILMLVAIGIDRFIDSVRATNKWIADNRSVVSIALVMLCLSPLAIDLGRALLHIDDRNKEYNRPIIEMAIDAYDADLATTEFARENIVARKSYFGYFADVETILLPYTDLAGLLTFMQLNDANYLFLEQRLADDYPFVRSLQDETQEVPLTLLFEHEDPHGGSVYLYRREHTLDYGSDEPDIGR